MKANENRDNIDEEYSFIQEKIVPKTKNTKRKLVRYVCFTVLLGVIFGGVSSLVFHASSRLFLSDGESNEKQPVLLETGDDEIPKVTEELIPSCIPNQNVEDGKKLEDIDIYRAFDVKSYQKQYAVMRNIAESCRLAMVTVKAVHNVTGLIDRENSENGYGIIIRIDDNYVYILCNDTTIEDAKKIEVAFYNNETVRAALVSNHEETSLAMLKIKSRTISERTRNKIEEIKLGESFQSAAGVPVLGLGAPDGTLGSVAIGYITAPCIDKYIVDGKLGLYHTNIMENAYAEGFFVNLSGKVIGVITHNYKEAEDENIMCFLGIERLKGIIQGMLNEKKQAYLGVKVCELSSNGLQKLNVDYGIYVTDVLTDSPAFKKGVRPRDVITNIDGISISSVAALMGKLQEKEPEDEIQLRVIRQTNVEYPKVSYENKEFRIKLE